MLSKFLPALAAAASLTLFTPSGATAADGLSDGQKKDVEKVIQEYILKNPELLIQAIQQYQIRQKIAEEERQRENLARLGPELNNAPGSPVIGNKDGDVTVVEFFDYRCGYCKRVFPTIQALLKEDGGIRYVMKEFPILGPDSLVASQLSLAVWQIAPDRYLDFHAALMKARGQLNEKKVLALAEDLGLDSDELRREMNSDAVRDELNKNMQLAESLGISGTPAFVVGEQLAPGAIGIGELKKMVAAAR